MPLSFLFMCALLTEVDFQSHGISLDLAINMTLILLLKTIELLLGLKIKYKWLTLQDPTS